MADKDTTTRFKADISQLKAAMQEAQRSVKLANAEFKAFAASLDDWGSSEAGLEAKLKQLNTVFDSQKKQLSLLEQELEKTISVYGENSAAADNLKIRIAYQQAAIEKTKKEIASYSQELEDCRNETGKFAKEEEQSEDAVSQLTRKIEDQEKELELLKNKYKNLVLEEGDTTEESKELAKEIQTLSSELKENKDKLAEAEKAADSLDNSMEELDDDTRSTSDGFTILKGVISNLVSEGIRVAISAMKDLATETFRVGSEFEEAMNNVKAISGASAEEMTILTEKAKELGENTRFSATQAAESFKYMAMAGWDTEDMLEGIEGLMNLAAASGEDLASVSDIVTDALTAMGYSAKDSGRFADVLAAAAANANTNVKLMGSSFQYAAPIAGAMGFNIEDLAVSIGLMANAGIKGEKSGTALRSMLTRLSAPTSEVQKAMDDLGVSLTDDAGNMRSLDDIMKDLRSGFSRLSQEQKTQYAKTIAGQEAMSGLLAITEATTEDFDKLTKAVQSSSGAANEMAKTMNDSVSGQLQLLKSNVEGKMIQIFESASGSIKDAIGTIGNAIDSLDWDAISSAVGDFAKRAADFFAYILENGDQVEGILKTIGALFIAMFAIKELTEFTTLITNLAPLFTALATKVAISTAATETATGAQLGLNAAMNANPIGLVIAALGILVSGIVIYNQKMADSISADDELIKKQDELIKSIDDTSTSILEANKKRDDNVKSIAGEYNYIQRLVDEYNTFLDENGKVKDGYEERAAFIKNEIAGAIDIEIEKIDEEIEKNGYLGDSITELIRLKQAELTLQAYESSYAEAKGKEAELLQNVIDAQLIYVDQEEAVRKAQEKVEETQRNYNDAIKTGSDNAGIWRAALKTANDTLDEAKQRLEDDKTALENANQAYTDSQTTIQNYEGLASSIIQNDAEAIQKNIDNLTNGFKDATSARREELEQQVKDYKKNYDDTLAAMEAGNPVITQEMVDAAKTLVDKAEEELAKLPPETVNIGTESGEGFSRSIIAKGDTVNWSAKTVAAKAEEGFSSENAQIGSDGEKAGEAFNSGIESKNSEANTKGQNLAEQTNQGILSQNQNAQNAGITISDFYNSGINSKSGEANAAGEVLGNSAKTGASNVDATPSGQNFGQGFINGIGNMVGGVAAAAANFVGAAIAAAKNRQKEGSPSKIMIESGEFFGEGYQIGIERKIKDVVKTATEMAAEAIAAVETESDELESSGEKFGDSFASGIKNSIGEIRKSVESAGIPFEEMQSDILKSQGILSQNQTAASSGSFGAGSGNVINNYNMNQTNVSPKALSALEIYRDTNSLLFSAKVRAAN